MKQKEFEQLKARLEETFEEKEEYRNIGYLTGYITGSVGTEFEERTYTETQLRELFDLVW